jgi:hypothetical protein
MTHALDTEPLAASRRNHKAESRADPLQTTGIPVSITARTAPRMPSAET